MVDIFYHPVKQFPLPDVLYLRGDKISRISVPISALFVYLFFSSYNRHTDHNCCRCNCCQCIKHRSCFISCDCCHPVFQLIHRSFLARVLSVSTARCSFILILVRVFAFAAAGIFCCLNDQCRILADFFQCQISVFELFRNVFSVQEYL